LAGAAPEILPMRRALLAVAVTASLLGPVAAPGPLGQLWQLLSSLWDIPATHDAGCIMDPSGGCREAPQPQPDEGCIMDPSGCAS
jgi:hypothetical protein